MKRLIAGALSLTALAPGAVSHSAGTSAGTRAVEAAHRCRRADRRRG